MPERHAVFILPSARAELKAIAKFTRQRWGARQRDQYMAEIDRALRMLSESPLIGEARDDLVAEIRLLPAGRHLIAYRVRPGQLQVVGFPHQSMDLANYFED